MTYNFHNKNPFPDIAREILELVIDGPETDSVWAAFQPEQDEESVIDEGEMEAQLMGVEI